MSENNNHAFVIQKQLDMNSELQKNLGESIKNLAEIEKKIGHRSTNLAILICIVFGVGIMFGRAWH